MKILSQRKIPFYIMDTIMTAANDLSKVCENWDVQSKLLQEQFPLLTKTDLELEYGKEDELLNRIQARLYKGREEILVIIKKWSAHKGIDATME